MKHFICTITGVIGGIVAALFGGWSEVLLVLVILMGIDYFSGLAVAGIFHKSPKSPNGGLESRAGLKGLVRKIFILALVAMVHLVDRLLGTSFFRDTAAVAFCMNEVISIVENAGLMGIPMPKVLMKMIDVLRQKAGEDEIAESAPPPRNDNEEEVVEEDAGHPPDG